MRKIIKVWLIVLVIWTIYRFLFRLPETIDEFLVKPLIFILLPLGLGLVKTFPGFEKKKNVFEDLLIGIFTGIVFGVAALLANIIKYKGFSFSPILPVYGSGILLYLLLSLATGTSEEIFGRGFVFKSLVKYLNMPISATISSLISISLHLPSLLFINHLPGMTLIIFITSIFILSMVNCYLYENRKSLVIPILVHAFWNMSVVLYL